MRQRASDWRESTSDSRPKWWRRQSLPTVPSVADQLWSAATHWGRGAGEPPPDTAARLVDDWWSEHAEVLEAAADLVLRQAITALLTRGWQPRDVAQIAARRLGADEAALVADAIAGDIWRQPHHPYLGPWLTRHNHHPAAALTLVLATVAGLHALPELPKVPLRETPPHVDDRMLAKIRALLAKAESTQFPEEAEALSAKAQELMSRHAFEAALDAGETADTPAGSARRFWLDAPYLSAKAVLVAAVASANRCRTVSYEKLGFVAIVGHEVDLDLVELMATSLLVQATEAMIAAGRHHTAAGQSKTKSFRRSFLLAYAARVRERLTEADATAAEQTSDPRLLPVLARRTEQVDALFDEMFPNTVRRTYGVTNTPGWRAGQAAANQAKLTLDRDHLPPP